MKAALDISFQPVASPNASRAGESQTRTHDDGLSAFMSVRPRLFGIAYRMLGSAADAEDLLQDVWVRWQAADRSLVRDPAAFLATTTTRLAINVMQSARSRRETCVGPWLPEPVDASADPGLGAERGEGLEAGILLLLEKLSPMERAAYVLREAFDYAYRDLANVLRLEEANARQVVTRARQHVATGRRMPASSTEQRRLLGAFIAAGQNGDVAGLEGLLASAIRRTGTHASSAAFALSRAIDCRCPLGNLESDQHKGIDHETPHHRRHRAHRIKARESHVAGDRLARSLSTRCR
jgi:RNA polymerase sigma-70 factor (ECF subfamily)